MSSALKAKILNQLNNGNDVEEFIINFIRPKTYGSFRTVAKSIRELSEKLYNDNHITKIQFDSIMEEIKKKNKEKKPEILFKLNEFYVYFQNVYEINKEDTESITNQIFLSLPFLFKKNYKSVSAIKIKDIQTFKIETGLIIKWKDELNKDNSILMSKYFDEWEYLFNESKKKNFEEESLLLNKISVNKAQDYTALNVTLEKILNIFIAKNASKLKYITEIKNALKYDTDGIFRNL